MLQVQYGIIDPDRHSVASGLRNFRDPAALVVWLMEEIKEGRTIIITEIRKA